MIKSGREYGPIRPTSAAGLDDMPIGVYDLGVRLIDNVVQVDQLSTPKYVDLDRGRIEVLRGSELVIVRRLEEVLHRAIPLQAEIVSGDDLMYGDRDKGERAYPVFARPISFLGLRAVKDGWEAFGDDVAIKGVDRLEKLVGTIATFGVGHPPSGFKKSRRR